MSPGLPIHISRSPFNVRLLTWGHTREGWWGLVVWEQRITRGGHPDMLACAAWVPAQALTKPGWSSGDTPARLALSGLRHEWPGPEGWQGWYVGPWVDGPLRLPPGAEIVRGPRWRDRK